jgi:SAM-dependent methyltransferase
MLPNTHQPDKSRAAYGSPQDPASNGLYVQYGSGWCAPASWRNFDASPTLRFERIPLIGRLYTKNAARFPKNVEYGDIVKGLPIEAESCKAIYCSHVLEHLSLEDFRVALRNTYRSLRRDGLFRFVMPDLEKYVDRYMQSEDPNAAITFMLTSGLGWKSRPRGIAGVLSSLGNSRHLWMWDYKSTLAELEGAGFKRIRRATFGDCSDTRFREVEEESRWKDCLGIECSR